MSNTYFFGFIIFCTLGRLTLLIYAKLHNQLDDIVPYNTKFFGSDILTSDKNRALLATYQQLSIMEENKLVVLSPKQEPKFFAIENNQLIEVAPIIELLNKGIGYYQTADFLWSKGFMKE